ncbi:MAG: hypothetical protein AB8B85_17490 [Paracoccaceae bacterium]
MRKITATILAGGLALSTAFAVAGPASERVFSRAALEQVKDSQQVVYTHRRTGKTDPLDNGEIRVLVQQGQAGRTARVTMGEQDKLRPVSEWPASSGNPVLPIFLESTLRTMAKGTGGSEFYIRNRIKEALGTGGTIKEVNLDLDGASIAATEITFEPFVRDKNRARMGGFADLRLVFLVSDALPGDVVRFFATTVAAEDVGKIEPFYSEEIAFSKLTGGN